MRQLAGLVGFVLLILAFNFAYYLGAGKPLAFSDVAILQGAKPGTRELTTGEAVFAVAMAIVPGVVGLGCLGYAFLSDD